MQELTEEAAAGQIILRWQDLGNNIIRVLRLKNRTKEQKQSLKMLLNAFNRLHDNSAVDGITRMDKVGLYKNYATGQCGYCKSLMLAHKVDKHMKARKCSTKKASSYTMIRVHKLDLCPICCRFFYSQSALMQHMGEEWTDKQFISLGYDPERFRGLKTRLVREPFVQSLTKELRDKQELQHATIVRDEASDNFFDLIVGVSDPVLAFIDKQFA